MAVVRPIYQHASLKPRCGNVDCVDFFKRGDSAPKSGVSMQQPQLIVVPPPRVEPARIAIAPAVRCNKNAVGLAVKCRWVGDELALGLR